MVKVLGKDSSSLHVVGIARDSHFRGIERPPDALLYEPLAMFPIVQNAYLVVRSTLGSRDAYQRAAEAARRIDPTIPLESRGGDTS